MNSGSLALEHVTRRFGEHVAVNDISFEVPPGELLALIGASGSGKTTTLRIAAGYEVRLGNSGYEKPFNDVGRKLRASVRHGYTTIPIPTLS